jgi:hypothetical protein
MDGGKEGQVQRCGDGDVNHQGKTRCLPFEINKSVERQKTEVGLAPGFKRIGIKGGFMKQTFAGKIKTKLNEWFNEPVGDVGIVQDKPDTELKKPKKVFKVEPIVTKAARGRGDKREVPHRIEAFHPRGAAGRREVHAPQGKHKAAMPHKGSHQRYPQ